MAALPPPPLPPARSAGGDGPVSLFLDTDLGTRLALPVAADSTVRHLKSQVAVEHAAAFPDFGPVTVKSLQVRRKGAMYHLSDSMIVRSAFTKVKAGCFLHVKMASAVTNTHCCRDSLAMEDRGRSSEDSLGVDLDKRVTELPAIIVEMPSISVPQGLGGGEDAAILNNVHAHNAVTKDVLLASSSLTERKNETLSMARDVTAISGPVIIVDPTSVANGDRPTSQSNMSLVGEELHTRKEDTLHHDGDHDAGVVPGNKEPGVEEVLKEMHATDDLSQAKKRKKARKGGSLGTSAPGPIRETNEIVTSDVTKIDQAPLEANINSSQQSIHRDIHLREDSVQLESPSIAGKSKKRKKRQLVTCKEVVSAQEMKIASTGAVGVSKDIGEVAIHKENQELQGEDTVNSTAEVVAGEKKSTKEGNGPRDESEKHDRDKQPIDNDGGHDEVAVETSNVEKTGKGKNILEKIHADGNTSPEKKRKKEKRVRCVDITSTDTAGEKDQFTYEEDATKSDIAPTQEGIVIARSKQQISSNVPHVDSNVTENLNVDEKPKKRRRRSESSKGINPTQDVTKLSGVITNERSMQNTNAASEDTKQTTPGTTREETTGDHKKLDESLDKATTDVIDEVLADLRSTDGLNKDLDGDIIIEQTHLDSNQNVRGLGNNGDKGGSSAALPPKHPVVVNSDAPISSPSHKKSKGKRLQVLSTVLGSCSSGGAPEENDNTEIRDSDKNNDLEGVVTENGIAQADDKTKTTKRQRKKNSLKHAPTDNGEASQSLGDQNNHTASEHLVIANTTKADLVQGGPVIDTCASTVGKEQEKSKRSSKKRTPKIQEMNHSAHGQDNHFAKNSQDKCTVVIGEIHDNQNMVGSPTQSHVVQKDATMLKSTHENARKGMKKSSKTEIQSQGFALEQGSDADLMNYRTERATGGPIISADAVEPNNSLVVNPVNDNINFLEYCSPDKINDKMNDTSSSAENKENNEDETTKKLTDKKKIKTKPDMQSQRADSIHLHTNKTSTGHCGISNVGVPSVSAEEMDGEDEVVKEVKEKKKSKRKSNLVKPVFDQDHPCGDHQQSDNCTNELLYSVVQKGTTEQDNGKENNEKVIQNDSLLQHEKEDGTYRLDQTKSSAGSGNNLPLDKDHVHMRKEQRKSTSETKQRLGPINERTSQNLKVVSNLVKSFSMSPLPSSESTESTPQNANRYRVAVRKVSRKRYEQASDRSKKEVSKRDTNAIFNDAISEGSDDVLNCISEKAGIKASPGDSSTSADSGGSSATRDGSDVPDDDGIVSLSQKSLKGMDIGSILRGSLSYKKARQKQTEEPDSLPLDGLTQNVPST